MRTVYFVQPYVIRRHKLMTSGALTFAAREEAVAVGARVARSRAGVVVLAQDIDPAAGTLSRPEVLAIHGRVPEGWNVPAAAAA